MTERDERKDLMASIRYALAYGLNGKTLPKSPKCPKCPEPDIAAERVLAHLERSAWKFAKGPPTADHTAGDYTVGQPK
jgi:hypothetical protein